MENTIERTECDKVAYGYFDPNRTPSAVSYEDAALRFAMCLRDKNVIACGKVRETMRDALPSDLYLMTLEKLADGDYALSRR